MKLEDQSMGITLTRRRMSQSALTDRVPVTAEIEFFRNISCRRLSSPLLALTGRKSDDFRGQSIAEHPVRGYGSDGYNGNGEKKIAPSFFEAKHPFHPDET